MMNGYGQLILAQLRIFARNRSVIFFSLLFPLILMVALGSFLGNGGGISVKTVLIDQDQSTKSSEFVKVFTVQTLLEVNVATDVETALSQLKKGDVQLVIVIPKGYQEKLGAVLVDSSGSKPPSSIQVYYDQTSQSSMQVGLPLVNQIVDQYDKQLVQYFSYIQIESTGVQSLHLKYIDFLVPGILAMMIMNNNLNGVVGQIASWRERGILRRMQSTTLKPSTFIAGQITARFILNGAQALIVLFIASLIFGTQVNGSWLWLLFFIVMGTLAFMSLGFIIAGIAKNPEQAGAISLFVSFPLLFLGGVFFPISNMPEFLQPFVKLLPISHLSHAIRQVMNVGAGFSEIWFDGLLLTLWAVVCFVISSRTFKWE